MDVKLEDEIQSLEPKREDEIIDFIKHEFIEEPCENDSFAVNISEPSDLKQEQNMEGSISLIEEPCENDSFAVKSSEPCNLKQEQNKESIISMNPDEPANGSEGKNFGKMTLENPLCAHSDTTQLSHEDNISSKTSHLSARRSLGSNHCENALLSRESCTYKAKLKTDLAHAHANEKAFQCESCSFKSNNMPSLRMHMRTHIDDTCNRKDDIVSPRRTHTDQKQFACKSCNYKGNQKANLVRHMRIHAKKKAFRCKSCFFETNYMRSLRKHMLTHMAGENW